MRILICLAIAALLYWYVVRPMLARWWATHSFFDSPASIAQAGLWGRALALAARLRLALKGIKTLLWGRLLAILGAAMGLTQLAGIFDWAALLPPVTLLGVDIPASAYLPGVVGPLLGWINNRLRVATTGPVHEVDHDYIREVTSQAARAEPAAGPEPASLPRAADREARAKRARRRKARPSRPRARKKAA